MRRVRKESLSLRTDSRLLKVRNLERINLLIDSLFLGLIFYDSDNMSIKLRNVPVVTPNCDIVVPNLTLDIEPGMHLLITGPSKFIALIN